MCLSNMLFFLEMWPFWPTHGTIWDSISSFQLANKYELSAVFKLCKWYFCCVFFFFSLAGNGISQSLSGAGWRNSCNTNWKAVEISIALSQTEGPSEKRRGKEGTIVCPRNITFLKTLLFWCCFHKFTFLLMFGFLEL